MASRIVEKIAEKAAKQADFAFNRHAAGRRYREDRTEVGAFLGEEANQIDGLDLSCGAGVRIEAACQQYLLNEFVEFGDASGKFPILVRRRRGANRLCSHPQPRKRRSNPVGCIRKQGFSGIYERLDALGGRIEGRGKLGDLVAPPYAHANGKSPRPKAATPFCSCSSERVSRRTTG